MSLYVSVVFVCLCFWILVLLVVPFGLLSYEIVIYGFCI